MKYSSNALVKLERHKDSTTETNLIPTTPHIPFSVEVFKNNLSRWVSLSTTRIDREIWDIVKRELLISPNSTDLQKFIQLGFELQAKYPNVKEINYITLEYSDINVQKLQIDIDKKWILDKEIIVLPHSNTKISQLHRDETGIFVYVDASFTNLKRDILFSIEQLLVLNPSKYENTEFHIHLDLLYTNSSKITNGDRYLVEFNLIRAVKKWTQLPNCNLSIWKAEYKHNFDLTLLDIQDSLQKQDIYFKLGLHDICQFYDYNFCMEKYPIFTTKQRYWFKEFLDWNFSNPQEMDNIFWKQQISYFSVVGKKRGTVVFSLKQNAQIVQLYSDEIDPININAHMVFLNLFRDKPKYHIWIHKTTRDKYILETLD